MDTDPQTPFGQPEPAKRVVDFGWCRRRSINAEGTHVGRRQLLPGVCSPAPAVVGPMRKHSDRRAVAVKPGFWRIRAQSTYALAAKNNHHGSEFCRSSPPPPPIAQTLAAAAYCESRLMESSDVPRCAANSGSAVPCAKRVDPSGHHVWFPASCAQWRPYAASNFLPGALLMTGPAALVERTSGWRGALGRRCQLSMGEGLCPKYSAAMSSHTRIALAIRPSRRDWVGCLPKVSAVRAPEFSSARTQKRQ